MGRVGAFGEQVFSIAVSAADGAVYAGTKPSALYRSDDRGSTCAFFTPHYANYPAVLIRFEHIMREELAERIEDAWLQHAPKRVVDEFLEKVGRTERCANHVVICAATLSLT